MNGTRKALTVADGTTLSYRVFEGSGPAIVILHGLAGSSHEFVPTAQALAPRKVVLIDQRGHGFSTRIPSDTSREAFVDDVVAVIDAEENEPIDLVGQSMGAHTAFLVAAAHPELVRRLALLECNEGSGTAEDSAALGDFFRSWEVPFITRAVATETLGRGPLARAWADDLEERNGGLYPRFDADVMERISVELNVPRWSEWESVSAPTLVAYADNGMFSEEQKKAFLARGKNARRYDLTNASHDAHLDAFEQWATELRAFVNP
ncbi:alpha/beta fold hydrolase [Arthrobacter sp. RAF14]|uniref:alpha/beta fold hydrolase n=1 Tax=Arthrobacter sp. RAF14 TaxID=3233051 RepID=UPI003F8E3B51